MRRFGIVLGVVLAFAVSVPALAKSGWMPLAPLPDPDGAGPGTGATEGACTAAVDNKIYVAYGFDPGTGDSNFLRIYNIATNTWSLGPAAPLPVRSEEYRGVKKGKDLYCLGKRPAGPGDTVRFNTATSTWTVLASMSDPRAGTSAAGKGDSIYVFGGRKGAAPCSGPAVAPSATFNTVLRYDIKTNTWSNAGNLVQNRSDTTVARDGDKIYVFGGCDGATLRSSIEAYDVKTGTSTLLAATLPSARSNAAAARLKKHEIHITGGAGSDLPVGTNHVVFDSHTGTISTDLPMPTHCPGTTARGEHELVAKGGRLYAVAGACPFAGTSINNLDVFHP